MSLTCRSPGLSARHSSPTDLRGAPVSHHLALPASGHRLRAAPQRAEGRGVIAFLALVFAASIAVAVMLPRSSAAPLISAFIPVAVLILLTPFGGRSVWSGLGLGRAGVRLWPVAVAVPVAVAATSYGIAWGLGMVKPIAVLGVSVVSLIITAAVTTVVVLGEELGWRGYLQPRIQQLTSRQGGAVLTAFAHAAVHLPLIVLTSTYNDVGSRWVIAPLSVVTIIGAGVFYAWLRDAARSIWPAAIAHAVGNTVLALLPAAALPTAAISVAYLAGEGGLVTALAMTLVAVVALTHARRNVWRNPTLTTHSSAHREILQ
jgi:membrane protease YdiL (CAAX protease family)